MSEDKNAAELALDAIAALCGCPQWDYPGQVVRDVELLAKRLTLLEAIFEEHPADVVRVTDSFEKNHRLSTMLPLEEWSRWVWPSEVYKPLLPRIPHIDI